MGKLIKARSREGFGIMNRAMNIKDPQLRADLLNKAAMKLAEYREANAGLARENETIKAENESLKIALDAALRHVAKLEGKPYPPIQVIDGGQVGAESEAKP